jgi:hypothetical protein
MHKWQILKKIKATQIEKNMKQHKHKQKIKSLIIFIKLDQMLGHIAMLYEKN